ncbi:WD40/YVTN/BNR-like repeat-containing protein [Candidatus Poribacteria bacterium]
MYESYTYHDRGSWKKTLHEKAMFFEKNTQERHNILGSYPSSVRLIPPRHYAGSQEGAWQQIIETGELPPGWTFDHGTTGLSNVAHTSSWTGCLLTAQAFRVAFLWDRYDKTNAEYREAYARANEIINSIRILTLVSGQPGYLARGVALGHGISYEERSGSGTRDLWAQGVGEFAHLRYRGGPSHHNYDQVFRGLGIYYFVAADADQQSKIREIVADMSNWAHLKNNLVVMHADGERISTELIGGWRGLGGDDSPSGGSVMALAGLKIASLITGNQQVKELYDTWVEKLGLRDPARNQESIMGSSRGNYDDTDHLLGDLYLLNIIEEDEELRAFYRLCVKHSWEAHQREKMAWFNFVYRAVLGDEVGDTEGSLWNLQTHPTCRIFQPRMNSIRTDMEFYEPDGVAEALHPLPVHERASDNEYEWKGSPYSLDGWTAHIVSVLEISPHDPHVQLAADASGRSYWSNTQGEIWHAMEGLPRVHDFLFSPDYPWIAFAATDSGVYRTLDGGVRWSLVFNQPISKLQFGPNNSHVLYAVGRQGVYRSTDMGERDIGTLWRCVSGDSPPESVFAVEPRGDSAVVYLLTRRSFCTKAEDESEWKAIPQITRQRGFSTVDPIGGRPVWLRVDPHIQGRLFRAVETERRGLMISVSDDSGETWSPVFRELKPLADWSLGVGKSTITRVELRSMSQRLREFQISDLRVDQKDPDVWYGMMETGVAVTRDAGNTWTVSSEGLDIPQVRAIWTPRHVPLVMVGTPAGMYVSNDQGKTWTDTALIPQGEGAIRSEIGGIGYLTAYWMGRYRGFISEEEANRRWWEE